MSDDPKIVRPTFGSRPRPVAPAPAEPSSALPPHAPTYRGPLEGTALVRAGVDLIYMLEHAEFVKSMRDKIERATDVIFSLGNFTPSAPSIELRRAGLRDHSLQALCEAIDHTDELQWRRQPSYIGALTLELDAHITTARTLLPQNEKDS